ncbi:hypothetical protein [Bartonella doshiae]|uniref:Uncharacterized protein n=2 Tax=Bartonella doshiae TaxID=33044 RepID=A0A380ZDL2_BARDO|nr:hypothetical protein [Bartonella doshiae]EJF80927.1 hypothetical protein MCS_00640 [Bartonella doshiae NCTC 12862 = ATCC 700133]MBB6159473.1 cytoskeletal protein RodZ [Bartonella doshiae]SUV45063.1 Uncharacterised protein [Bartonella doshiae]
MIDRKYPTYEEYRAAKKIEREQRNLIGKGIFAIILALLILWFIFGFFGSFFEKSSKHISHYNATESSQTITLPKSDLNTTFPVPNSNKDTTSSLYEQIPSGEKAQKSISQEAQPTQAHEQEKSNMILIPEVNQ